MTQLIWLQNKSQLSSDSRSKWICEWIFLLAFALLGIVDHARAIEPNDAAAAPTEADAREAWTTSRIVGSPESPLPLTLEPAFPKLKFNDPMHVRWQADEERYFVCELGGKIWSFSDEPDVSTADLVVDLKTSLKSFDAEKFSGCDSVYSLVFDPVFTKNRYVYVCIILKSSDGKPHPEGSRVSRFEVTRETPPTIDVASELPIITWVSGGHNGCDLAFDGQDNLLISTGDAAEPSPPDRLATGQDISDLLSSVLRIDVRGASREEPYAIPNDNPFRETERARPEVWAYGFRNPWRISVDPETSQLWLGDVGWEKWELVHRVERGGNYGWSVREGEELLQPNAAVGPTPILPTRVALPHTDAASITGGYIYRGEKLAEIRGQYLFGDWITGRIWAVPLDDSSSHHEVASGPLRIIAFAPDRDGEPLVVNHFNGTTLYRLVPNPHYADELEATQKFPRLLSQTGLFDDVESHTFVKGVRRFTVNQPQWSDGASSTHALALPDLAQVTVFNEPQPVGAIAMFNSRLHYPPGTVLVKTLSLPSFAVFSKSQHPRAESQLPRRIETQLLHFDGRLWRGMSYVWREDQSDAELAPAQGQELNLPFAGGQRWHIPSRTECLQCHNPWPETTLAFNPEQLHQAAEGDTSEWLTLVKQGYVVTLDRDRKPIDPAVCVRADLTSTELEGQARAYLHVNCAHCHQDGAGAAVDLSLRITDKPGAMKAIGVPPSKGNFAIDSAKLIQTGSAEESTLIFRMASSAIGRMPHIGSREIDFGGVALVARWIDSLPESSTHGTAHNDSSRGSGADSLDVAPIVHDSARSLRKGLLQKRANEIIESHSETAGEGTSLLDRSEFIRKALALSIDLATAKSEQSNVDALDAQDLLAIAALAKSKDPLVSTLFEGHLPAPQRLRRLGASATFAEIADLPGDPAAGRNWFFDGSRSQCAKCHRVDTEGQNVGPDLSAVGKKLSPAQLFEAVADPSRIIEPKYQSQLFVTMSGQILSGIVVEESPTRIVLLDSQGARKELAASEIDSRKRDVKSIMPSGLTGELTAQQAADLIAYLSSLKSESLPRRNLDGNVLDSHP